MDWDRRKLSRKRACTTDYSVLSIAVRLFGWSCITWNSRAELRILDKHERPVERGSTGGIYPRQNTNVAIDD